MGDRGGGSVAKNLCSGPACGLLSPLQQPLTFRFCSAADRCGRTKFSHIAATFRTFHEICTHGNMKKYLSVGYIQNNEGVVAYVRRRQHVLV